MKRTSLLLKREFLHGVATNSRYLSLSPCKAESITNLKVYFTVKQGVSTCAHTNRFPTYVQG